MKRIISLLLSLVLIMGLIPGVFAEEGGRYLALGDSITAGTALNEGEPAFPQILAEHNGWELTNLGTDGQTAGMIYEQISDGSIDEVIRSARIITITTGGNDVMDALYELIAQRYNESFDDSITPDDVVPIMIDPDDDRRLMLMMVAVTILNGSENSGVPPFSEREEFLAKIEECTANLKEVMAYIRNLNPHVTVIVPTQYNPYDHFSEMLEVIGDSIDAGAWKLNAAIEACAEECGYLVADVYTAFRGKTDTVCNATMDPLNLDFHPNARGHEVIAGLMQEIIDQIPEVPEPIVNPFEDVREEDYFFESVLWAVENGITNGTSPTTFRPDNSCVRAQVVTFLWRVAGEPEPTSRENPFTDVMEGEYYYDAVLWAVEKGITNGTSPTTFSPDRVCVRAQVVTFLWRYAGKPEPASAANPFEDLEADGYYVDAVLWAVEEEITNGTSPVRFSPDRECTRAHVVTFLYRSET